MRLVTHLAIYFLVWWLVLFAVLPWGASSAHELGADVEPGHAPSAPMKPLILRKIIATTLISALIMAGGLWLVASGFLSLDSFTFLPDPRR
jgi:predicted secreted protein